MDPIVLPFVNAARSWKEEAKKRRAISATDPVADTLEYCAGELAARLQEAEQTTQGLTVEEYARLDHVRVTPQTVRTWIRRGQLAAIDTPTGYRIARDAKRVRAAS